MTRKIFTITLLVTIILAGCNSQTPTEAAVATSTVTLEPTVTEAPVQATVAIELSPTATELPPGTPSTPETPRPTNEANCTNSAAFVTDVTIPDNTPIVAGTLLSPRPGASAIPARASGHQITRSAIIRMSACLHRLLLPCR